MKKIISVVGARPNFMKIAPIHRAFLQHDTYISHKICHTGQHFDANMSAVFFDEFGLPQPDFVLGVGGGGHAEQTGKVMIAFEKICIEEKPDLVLVVGDVNSTLAASLVAVKLGIRVAHIESGLRSFDKQMPEEINRILTDSISDYLFVTEQSGIDNLLHEGIPKEKIFFVGNTMIDNLVYSLPKIEKATILQELGLQKEEYIVATFHRPSNVDNEENLASICKGLNQLSSKTKVIFPMHPRTRKNLEQNNLLKEMGENIIILEPLGYINFMALVKSSKLVLTDSGGIQEETTYLKKPCITLRNSTERPVTVDIGSNFLVGSDVNAAITLAKTLLSNGGKQSSIPPLWDGNAAHRIAEEFIGIFDR